MMNNRKLPFTKNQIEAIAGNYSTPFYLYDEKGIRETSRNLYRAYQKFPGFKNYFPIKSCPNPHILKILSEEGMGTDCSSLPELVMSEKIGITGEEIMFSSNDTAYNEFSKAYELGAFINLDDITHIPILEKYAGIPVVICFRYNPGPMREHQGNVFIGKPEEAKFGMTKSQLFEAYQIMKQKGVKRFGLHTMIAAHELDPQALIETADMLFALVVELSQKLGIRFEFIDLGGGIGIPYKTTDKPVDLDFVSGEIKKLYDLKIRKNKLDPLRIVMENGRLVMGTNGYLITKVIHTKEIYKNYLGLDACMTNLMRPGMYGAYHHITVLGKEKEPETFIYDVVGSLCENNDKFAIDRKLPKVEIGDILVIHDAGAYGYAMGFNFNAKLRSAELLLKEDGQVVMIRRAETIEDYFATLNF